jgi:hypothetical protein
MRHGGTRQGGASSPGAGNRRVRRLGVGDGDAVPEPLVPLLVLEHRMGRHNRVAPVAALPPASRAAKLYINPFVMLVCVSIGSCSDGGCDSSGLWLSSGQFFP